MEFFFYHKLFLRIVENWVNFLGGEHTSPSLALLTKVGMVFYHNLFLKENIQLFRKVFFHRLLLDQIVLKAEVMTIYIFLYFSPFGSAFIVCQLLLCNWQVVVR